MPPSAIDQFIAALSAAKPDGNLFNPYGRSASNPHNAARRQNLSRYLHQLTTSQTTALLIGEAPGYRGCRLTGIPFTSPARLPAPYQPVTEWPHIRGEASATILQQAIAPCQPQPAIWNVLPFHPHQPNRPQSNRTPTKTEVALGRPFLTHLLTLLPPNPTVIAIGKHAQHALAAWHIPHTAVRHPSHGGKAEFLAGLHHAGILP